MVSIIIPVYNVQDYIVKCLESVAAQTYNGAMECLIIDDCGQDESIRLAEDFVASYIGTIEFRIIHHNHNKGLSAARNTGIQESRGEWLYFLDSDDWIYPICIGLMIEAIQEFPDVDLVFAGTDVSTNEHVWLDYSKKKLPKYSNDSNWLQYSMLKRYDFGMTAWNKFIRRDFIIKNNLSFAEGMIHEDEIWNFQLSQVIHSASFVNQNTYMYFKRGNSIVFGIDEKVRMSRYLLVWNRLVDLIGKHRCDLQIKGICNHIIEYTTSGVEILEKKQLSYLFLRMVYHASPKLAFFLIIQSILVFVSRRLYNNTCITNHIKLY